LRLVEEPTADPFDEAAREQGPTGTAWAGEDRRLDLPQAPLAKMFECFAIGVGDDETGVAFALGPVERKGDLVRALLHSCLPEGSPCGGAGCGCAGGGGGGGSAGGLFDADLSFTTLPPVVSTTHPRPPSAAASSAMLP